MQVAEKADRAPVGTQMRQYPHRRGLHDPLGCRRVTLFVERAEITAVEHDVLGILAAKHGVRLGSGSDEDRAGRQHDDLFARSLVRVGAVAADLGHAVPGQPQRRGLAKEVDFDLDRGEQFRKADALLHRFCDFLVIEGVARRVD